MGPHYLSRGVCVDTIEPSQFLLYCTFDHMKWPFLFFSSLFAVGLLTGTLSELGRIRVYIGMGHQFDIVFFFSRPLFSLILDLLFPLRRPPKVSSNPAKISQGRDSFQTGLHRKRTCTRVCWKFSFISTFMYLGTPNSHSYTTTCN